MRRLSRHLLPRKWSAETLRKPGRGSPLPELVSARVSSSPSLSVAASLAQVHQNLALWWSVWHYRVQAWDVMHGVCRSG